MIDVGNIAKEQRILIDEYKQNKRGSVTWISSKIRRNRIYSEILDLKNQIDFQHIKLIERTVSAHLHATDGYITHGSLIHVVDELQGGNKNVSSVADYIESYCEQTVFFLSTYNDNFSLDTDDILTISKYGFRCIDALTKIQEQCIKDSKIQGIYNYVEIIFDYRKLINTLYAIKKQIYNPIVFDLLRNKLNINVSKYRVTSFNKRTLGDKIRKIYESLTKKQKRDLIDAIILHFNMGNEKQWFNDFLKSFISINIWYFQNFNNIVDITHNYSIHYRHFCL